MLKYPEASTSLIILLSMYGRRTSSQTQEFMDKSCGSTVTVYDSVIIRLTSMTSYSPNMNCSLAVETRTDKKLMLFFMNFNVENSCTDDWLEVKGEDSTTFVAGLNGRLCGHRVSNSVYKTEGNRLYLKFTSDRGRQYSGFDLVVTAFHTGYCLPDEISCNNGRCVHAGLKCNGYNPCGDFSDCDVTLSTGTIIGIVIGSIFCVVLATSFMLSIRGRKRKSDIERSAVFTITSAKGYDQPIPVKFSELPSINPKIPSQNDNEEMDCVDLK